MLGDWVALKMCCQRGSNSLSFSRWTDLKFSSHILFMTNIENLLSFFCKSPTQGSLRCPWSPSFQTWSSSLLQILYPRMFILHAISVWLTYRNRWMKQASAFKANTIIKIAPLIAILQHEYAKRYCYCPSLYAISMSSSYRSKWLN